MFFIYVFIYLYCSEFSIITQRVPLLFVLSYTIIYPQIFACFTSLKTKRYFLVVFVLYSVLKLAESNNEIFPDMIICCLVLKNMKKEKKS